MPDGTIYYVGQVPPENWLLVKPASGANISVPYGLKLKSIELRNGRRYFEILEGVHIGKVVSITASGAQSYLTTELRHQPGGPVVFDLAKQTILFGGQGPYNAFSGGGSMGFTPVSRGQFKLAIPAFPTAQTRPQYSTWTRYHRSWFRIGIDVSGSRFLHPGAISEGCVTVRQFIYDPGSSTPPPQGFGDLPDLAANHPGLIGLPLPATRAATISWDRIYDYLILRRLDEQSVGTLTVI